CGHLPFTGSFAQISNQQLYAVPPALCDQHPEIPEAVEQVVLKGLSKDPEQRFVDVMSFARAFEEACTGYSTVNMLSSLSSTSVFESSSYVDELPSQIQNIPLPLTTLIGRESELQAVRDLLLRPEVRLVTLTGSGGIGKTHLALTLGNELQGSFAEGVSFISLASIYDSELVVPAIVHALGLKEIRDHSPMQVLKTFLRDKNHLIILDNFEQVLPAAPHISDLLSACSQLKIMVTSRAVLHVWGEFTFRVQSLEVPDLQQLPELESLSQIASIALFVQRAEAILPEFKLTDENAQDVAVICDRLEGMPLALELTAAHCKLLSPHTIVSRLKHPIELLTGGRRDAPLRHQSLRNMLSWNDDLLSPDEQKLFRRLAIFDRGFTLQAAEAIMSVFGDMSISVLEGITTLIDNSMVQQTAFSREEPRLYFLEVLREYGLEGLAECGELDQARDAHASYFTTIAEAVTFDLNPADWQKQLQYEVCNLQAALEWLKARGEKVKTWHIASALEKMPGRSRDTGMLLLSKGANDSVLSQFDPILKDNLFEEEKLLNRPSHAQQDYVSNLNYVSNVIPGSHNHRSESTYPSSSPFGDLTIREIEVLRLLALGLSNKQIAERLILSPHTVSGHIQSIFGKLALNSRSAATRYALEHHLA
ncbi:MAG TPA: LuxR C-terminal-related transcriptional regulator, partial [Ktedonobacteraceae bacterium]|nr:LuxR C-terminal-related transcriptional regulator [Ktedonobacteraceae bacterium]